MTIKVIVEFQAKPGARPALAGVLKGISATHGPGIPGFLGSVVHEVVDSPDALVEIAEWDSATSRRPPSRRQWHPACTHLSSSW